MLTESKIDAMITQALVEKYIPDCYTNQQYRDGYNYVYGTALYKIKEILVKSLEEINK